MFLCPRWSCLCRPCSGSRVAGLFCCAMRRVAVPCVSVRSCGRRSRTATCLRVAVQCCAVPSSSSNTGARASRIFSSADTLSPGFCMCVFFSPFLWPSRGLPLRWSIPARGQHDTISTRRYDITVWCIAEHDAQDERWPGVHQVLVL